MNRREFIVGGIASTALAGCRCPFCGGSNIRLAMAGYTLHRFKAEEALAFCEKHGFRYLCVKSMHLPLTAKPKEVAEFRRLCADHGVTPYGAGPIYMYSADEAKRSFDYAAELGVDVISGAPAENIGPRKICANIKLCELVSDLTAQYNIRFAIHNHGRNPATGDPNFYPALPETWEIVKDLDPRVGFCADWAYTYADGLDCAEMIRRYASRIHDGHVRCLSDAKNGSSGTTPLKRVFDYDGIFAALKEVGYDGCLGLELANAFPDNVQWIDESRDYFEGLIAAS